MAKKDEVCERPSWLKCVIFPTAAVFVLISAYQFLFHGVLMAPHYDATADMWRSPEEMAEFMNFSYLMTALLSFVLVMLYCCHTKNKECGGKCPSTGMKFGLMIGLLLGLWDLHAYAWLPFETMTIPLAWMFGTIIMGLLIGLLLSCLKGGMCKKQ